MLSLRLFHCLSCESSPAPYSSPLCTYCASLLIPCPDLCPTCWGHHGDSSEDAHICNIRGSIRKSFGLCSVSAMYASQGTTHEILKLWKIRGSHYLDQQILNSKLLKQKLKQLPQMDYIVPIPQSDARKKALRPGGSSARLGTWIHKQTGWPILNSALETENQTFLDSLFNWNETPKKSQGTLRGHERWENPIRFREGPQMSILAGARVLLVDDFVTTGRTLGAARQLLQALGCARSIHGFSLGIRLLWERNIE